MPSIPFGWRWIQRLQAGLKNAFAVVEQAPYEGALAVVDIRGGEPEEAVVVGCGCCCHCFVPSRVQRSGLEIPFFLRSSMALSCLSSARPPRFVIRVAIRDDLFWVSASHRTPSDGENA